MKSVYQLIAAAIYVSLFFLLFPFYRYVMDADGISYVRVAELIANGEYHNSLNACWSPLASWILVPFIKAGFDTVLSAKYINGVLGLLTLFSCYKLADKFNINETLKKILPFPLAILAISGCFYELCADLLIFFLLSIYLNLIFTTGFVRSNLKIALAGALGATCYFAKAYCFPFFLLQFLVTLIFLLKKDTGNNFFPALIKKAVVAFSVFFIIVAPYVIALSAKYGSPTISSAGKLNVSWSITDPGDNPTMVIEPPYHNSVSYWDDPTFYNQDKFVGPLTSFKYFQREVRWATYNMFKFFDILNGISIFSITIFISFLLYLLFAKKDNKTIEWLLFITAIIYQAGLLPIYIDWRYLWIIVVSLLIMLSILLSFLLEKNFISKKIMMSAAIIFLLSFIHQPLEELKKLNNYNKDAFEIADAFNKNNIKGNFLFFNFDESTLYQKTLTVCYLTKSKIYGSYRVNNTFDGAMQNAKKYNIDYFLFYYEYSGQREMFLQSAYLKAGIKVFDNLYPGLIVVQLK